MPSLKEIKDMLKRAEQEAEAAVDSMLGVAQAPVSEPVSEPVEATEPVFVTERPYGQVDGIPGVKYQQDGEYFDSQRKFVRKA